MTFGGAFLTLLRSATGEKWPYLLNDMTTSQPNCVDDPPYDATMCGFAEPPIWDGCVPINGCAQPLLATIYWYSFIVIMSFIMLNLITFSVLDSFSSRKTESDGVTLSAADEAVRTRCATATARSPVPFRAIRCGSALTPPLSIFAPVSSSPPPPPPVRVRLPRASFSAKCGPSSIARGRGA